MQKLTQIDYQDTHSVQLPSAMTAQDFCQTVLTAAPHWIGALIGIRDWLLRPFGFSQQTSNYGQPVRLEVGKQFGPLQILEITDDIVVCDSSDRHLECIASFSVTGQTGSLTTQVYTKDQIGKLYFRIIRPFHVMIIPLLLKAPFKHMGQAKSSRN